MIPASVLVAASFWYALPSSPTGNASPLPASGVLPAPGARIIFQAATVKTHVGRILTKLQLRDRVQAVVLAYETGLAGPGAPAGPLAPQAPGSPH